MLKSLGGMPSNKGPPIDLQGGGRCLYEGMLHPVFEAAASMKACLLRCVEAAASMKACLLRCSFEAAASMKACLLRGLGAAASMKACLLRCSRWGILAQFAL